MDDTSKNIEEYIPNQKQKILILFDDMIADMLIVTDSNWIIYQRKKTKYFSSFYYTILFCCSKQYYTNFN